MAFSGRGVAGRPALGLIDPTPLNLGSDVVKTHDIFLRLSPEVGAKEQGWGHRSRSRDRESASDAHPFLS